MAAFESGRNSPNFQEKAPSGFPPVFAPSSYILGMLSPSYAEHATNLLRMMPKVSLTCLYTWLVGVWGGRWIREKCWPENWQSLGCPLIIRAAWLYMPSSQLSFRLLDFTCLHPTYHTGCLTLHAFIPVIIRAARLYMLNLSWQLLLLNQNHLSAISFLDPHYITKMRYRYSNDILEMIQ